MKSFQSSNLPTAIIEVLTTKNIEIPTEIQAKAIPILLDSDGDFVGRSATGTGKTIAFGAPLLSKIDATSGKVQAIVLVPTRELAEQVSKELIALAKNIENLKIEGIYGGVSLKAQINTMSNGVHVIVATPGRLMDLINRKVVALKSVKTVVFDEADEMLLKGFSTDVDQILASTDKNYSSWLFSATMPQGVNEIINKYLNKSLQKVIIGKDVVTNQGIQHQILEVLAEEKQTILLDYLTRIGKQKVIIFCRTKSGVQKLYKQLSAQKFASAALHGSLPQGLRNKVMEQFKEGHVHILIATDVASRGVDVEALDFVIQYHLPDTKESYLHRSGRTSRAGRTGNNLTFIFPEEKNKLKELGQDLSINFEFIDKPTYKDQMINKAVLWGRKIAKQKYLGRKIIEQDLEVFRNEIKHLSKEELVQKMLANYLREQQE